MTKRNLTAVIMAAVLSVALLTGIAPTEQAYTKSVTPEATHSVTMPSTRVGDFPPRADRSQVRKPIIKKAEPVKVKPQKPVAKPKAPEKKQVTAPRPVNVVGVQASAWTGAGYSPRWENVRKCIVKRESNGQYGARNPSSSAQGAYQFLDNLWRKVLAQKLNKPALAGVPIASWSRIDQDRSFWIVFANGAGKSHWNYPAKQCW
jgi:outer membrane biosynthesis protein TonB